MATASLRVQNEGSESVCDIKCEAGALAMVRLRIVENNVLFLEVPKDQVTDDVCSLVQWTGCWTQPTGLTWAWRSS